MKKLMLGTLICLAFVACETKYYSVLISNNSSKDVSYEYNGSSDTLDQGKSKTYQVKAYTQSPKNISVTGTMSIRMEDSNGDYLFIDVTPIELHVANTLPADITIKSDNYIDDSGSIELTVESMKEKTTAKIYTKNPKFTVLSGYPAVIDWNIQNDIMYVTIR
jgi:hypothetical protein